MKRYMCFKCIAFGGKDPCVLACENDLIPTHCPHDDSKYPNAYWEIDASQPSAAPDSEGEQVESMGDILRKSINVNIDEA